MSHKRLFEHLGAEREADEVGSRFMDSKDVVGDMSRAYGHDFSQVQIHADEAAASRVSGTGADAIAAGNHVYFGRGIYQPGDPASNGLLAHELTHTMQQSGGGAGIQQTAPMGAPQGGRLWDWMKKKFSRNKLSAPTPAPAVSNNSMGVYGPTTQLPMGPVHQNFTVKERDPTSSMAATRNYMSSSSYALHQMLQNASREQLQDPKLRELVIQDYNQNMNQRLKDNHHLSKFDMDTQFRGGAGELNSLNMILGAALPEDFAKKMVEAGGTGGALLADPDASLNYAMEQLGQNQDFLSIMEGIAPSFKDVNHYDNQSVDDMIHENRPDMDRHLGLHGSADQMSNIMMNNLMLRVLSGGLSRQFGKDVSAVSQIKKDNPGISREDLQKKTREAGLVDSSYVQYMAQLQAATAGKATYIDPDTGSRATRMENDENGVGPGQKFRTFLHDLFQKKRS